MIFIINIVISIKMKSVASACLKEEFTEMALGSSAAENI
jgi:hypothetical protein